MRPATERLEEWHGDRLYVFENVPAWRCDECGEIWLGGRIAEKLDEMEQNYDAKFKIVFDVLRQLMEPPKEPRRPIGFTAKR